MRMRAVKRKVSRIKAPIPKNSYTKYKKRKHDYTKCHWCNHVIGRQDNFCENCGISILKR